MNKEAREMRYLLRTLSDDESTHLEEKYFTDDEVFEQIGIAEDELVDAYVRGELSPDDRDRFEKNLSTSRRLQDRIEFARLLSKSAASQPASWVVKPAKVRWWNRLFDFSSGQNPVLRPALVSGILLLVLGPTLFVWMQVRSESQRLGAERAAIEQQRQELAREIANQQSKTNQLATELQNAKAQEDRLQQQLQTTKEQLAQTNQRPPPSATVAALLFPFFSRDPSAQDVLAVPSHASTIQLKLALESDDYPSYRVTVRSADRDVLTRQDLRPRRSNRERIIVLQIPSRSVASGEYVLNVSGLTPSGTYEPVADYRVRLSKK